MRYKDIIKSSKSEFKAILERNSVLAVKAIMDRLESTKLEWLIQGESGLSEIPPGESTFSSPGDDACVGSENKHEQERDDHSIPAKSDKVVASEEYLRRDQVVVSEEFLEASGMAAADVQRRDQVAENVEAEIQHLQQIEKLYVARKWVADLENSLSQNESARGYGIDMNDLGDLRGRS
nr:uncharacterized protein LOC118878929 [Drosophila suzukii]